MFSALSFAIAAAHVAARLADRPRYVYLFNTHGNDFYTVSMRAPAMRHFWKVRPDGTVNEYVAPGDPTPRRSASLYRPGCLSLTRADA